MTRTVSILAAVLSAVCTSFACSTASSAGPTGVSLLDRIGGGSWTLVAQQPAGEQAIAPPRGSNFAFQIVEGRAAVTADCNRCNGLASVSNASVTFGPALACTRAYCVTSAPFDTTFMRLLAEESRASIDGNTLTLRSERGTLRFKK